MKQLTYDQLNSGLDYEIKLEQKLKTQLELTKHQLQDCKQRISEFVKAIHKHRNSL